MRGATGRSYASGIVSPVFQSTHPVRGATRVRRFQHLVPAISLHAPREGCDTANDLPINFSYIFQSTHPVRGATNGGREGGWPVLFQSTHPVRGATPADVTVSAKLNLFQSTHPVRGATESDQHARLGRVISIHAPREGCDFLPLRVRSRRHISIHAPCEGCDTKREVNLDLRRVFQSTHPVRGATARAFRDHVPRAISIHAPREGCDVRTRHHPSIPCYFNPRTP